LERKTCRIIFREWWQFDGAVPVGIDLQNNYATQDRNASQLMKSEDDTILIFIDCECCSFFYK
jgi:hypothetical protein